MHYRRLYWKPWMIIVILASSLWLYGCSPVKEHRSNEMIPSTPVDTSSEPTTNKENDKEDHSSSTDLETSYQGSGEDIHPSKEADKKMKGDMEDSNSEKDTELNRDIKQGVEKEASRESTKEQKQEIGKESTKEPSKEVNKEATKEPSKEVNKEDTKEPSKEVNKEATKEPKEAAKESGKEAVKVPSKEATKEADKDRTTTPEKKPVPTRKAEDSTHKSELSMESIATDIINTIINSDMNDVEKVRVVHDYIVLNTEYDYDNLLADTVPMESFTIEGVLVHGKAVCQGYAETFQLFMELLGIESKFITGTDLKSNVGHAWNQVKLDGDWYHIDTTWDDPVPDQKGKVQYKYFLVTDEVLSVDHSWDKSKFPESNGRKYQYYVYQDYMIDSIEDYEKKFIELYQEGNDYITILYPERGMPEMDFLGKYDYFYKEVDGRSVVTYGWYPTWVLGDYTVLTVFLK